MATRERARNRRAWVGSQHVTWSKAIEVFEQVERLERAWGRAVFDLFRPNGQFNDRNWAEAEIRAGLSELVGPDWYKVRNFLTD